MTPKYFGRTIRALALFAMSLTLGHEVKGEETPVGGIAHSIGVSIALEENIKKLGDIAAQQEGCRLLALLLLGGSSYADIEEKTKKPCNITDIAEDDITAMVAFSKVQSTLDPALNVLANIETLFKGFVPPTPAPTVEDLEAKVALRFVNVLAGDLDTANYCQGQVPIQQLVVKCFGKVEDDADTGLKVIKLPNKTMSSCYAPDVTVTELCGYDPSKDGAHSIKIKYSCGGVVVSKPYLLREQGTVAIACNHDKFTALAGR